MLHAFDRADIDGFYGEPAEHDESLVVELLLAEPVHELVREHVTGPVSEHVTGPVSELDDDDRITAPMPRLREVALSAETISLEGLEDEWFASFDENAPVSADAFEDEPTTTWEKIGVWLKSFGRAA